MSSTKTVSKTSSKQRKDRNKGKDIAFTDSGDAVDAAPAVRSAKGEKGKRASGETPVTLLPLGGVGRIGMNAMLLGYGEDRILLDCGVMFPDEDITGVDVLLPSLQKLAQLAPTIRAIVLTHGHEDHIGAVPFVARLLKVPIYATRFTAGLVAHKLREHNLQHEVDVRLYKPGDKLTIGPFVIEPLRITHSIPDAVSLAIRTPIGTLFFTGDFKIEQGLRDGSVFDEAGFRALGDEGVLLLMSDSTNAEVPGWSGNEADVAEALVDAVGACEGRVIASLFASNIYRLHSMIDAARHNGRYVVLLGRSLKTYTECANSFTDMRFDAEDIIDVKEMDRYDDNEIMVICTGSQAEPRAVLARAALGEHPDLSIRPTDTIILSSRQIPGNERKIHQMLNDFARRGAHVVYQRNNRAIHCSGHAYAEEQKQVLQWLRPKFFFPVHGEYTFLQRHADLAKECGVNRTIVAENGQELRVFAERVDLRDVHDVAPWYADGTVVGDEDALEIKARRQLAWNGAVAVSLLLRRRGTAKVGSGTGFVGTVQVKPTGVYQGAGRLSEELRTGLQAWLGSLDANLVDSAIEDQVRIQTRRICKRFTTRKPVVLAMVQWLDAEV